MIIGGVAIAIGTGFALFKYRKLILELFKQGKKLLDVGTTGAAGVAKVASKVREEMNPTIIDEITPENKEQAIQAIPIDDSYHFENETSDDYSCVDADVSEIADENKIYNNGNPFKVNGHIRRLGEHRQPSPEKRQEAEAMGISLGDHETFVDSYEKNTYVKYLFEPVFV